MKLKFVISFCLAGILLFNKSEAQAQFNPPMTATLDSKEDYVRYETTMVEAARWLETTDLDKESEKRKLTNSFVVRWITGSPTVTVSLGEQLLKLYGKNDDLLVIYLAAYASHFIENKSAATDVSATKSAIQAMMTVYKKGISIKKSKEMEKLLKMNDAELDTFVKEKMIVAK